MKARVHIRKSIFMRLVLSLSLVTILSIALVSFVLYKNAARQFERTFFDYNAHILDGAMRDFENYLEELSDFSLNIRQDEALLDSLAGGDFSIGISADKLSLLNAGRRNLGIRRVEYYIPSVDMAFRIDDEHISIQGVSYKDQPWFSGIAEDKKLRYVSPGYQEQGVFFSYFRSLIDFGKGDRRALIVRLDVDPEVARKVVALTHLADGEMLFFFEQRGNLLFGNQPSFLIRETRGFLTGDEARFSYRGKEYLRTASRSSDGDFLMVKVVPVARFFDQMRPVLLASIGIALFFIILSIALSFVAIQRITGSVYRLVNQIEKLPEGELSLPGGNDEIGAIAGKLGEMNLRIKQHVNTERMLVLSEQKALQKALEARVNPHFLYNSLQAISGKALSSGDNEVVSMIEALSRTYRYVLGNEKSAALMDELENVQNYITVSRLRFGDRLRLSLDVDDMALEDTLPRLCLQVIVENSVKYALEQNGEPVHIRVSAKRRNEYLDLVVEDDGVGMDAAPLASLIERIERADYLAEDEKSTGLISLYGRLRLFDPEVKFKIESEKGAFFRVSISLSML